VKGSNVGGYPRPQVSRGRTVQWELTPPVVSLRAGTPFDPLDGLPFFVDFNFDKLIAMGPKG